MVNEKLRPLSRLRWIFRFRPMPDQLANSLANNPTSHVPFFLADFPQNLAYPPAVTWQHAVRTTASVLDQAFSPH